MSHIIYFIIAIIIAISIHEAAHAYTANYLGDPTAKMKGRMTLNPLRHLDAVGTMMLLIVGIGWGKPVPVNPGNFRDPLKGSAITSLAGPVSNFLTAILLAIPLKYFGGQMPGVLREIILMIFEMSILLGVFNLLPLPPLDGSKIFGLFLPKRWHRGYMEFLEKGVAYFVIFLVLDAFLIRKFFGFSVFGLIIGTLFSLVRSVILMGT